MNIHSYTNVIKKYFFTYYTQQKSRYRPSNNTHVRLPYYNVLR